MSGTDVAVRRLLKESGGHRWQRIPPTERSGRVHTSTVTVAVFEAKEPHQFVLKDGDIYMFTTMDSGPGGQHRNKTESCVVMRHKPTGIEAKSATKSQHRNKQIAREMLEGRVAAHFAAQTQSAESQKRKAMVGTGMRGDKVRTYRTRDDQVTDHRTNKKARLQDVLAGRLDKLE